MKLLILLPESIGDLVFSTPVIRALKTQCAAEVHAFVAEEVAFLLEENPYIDRLVPAGASLPRLFQAEKYTWLLNLSARLWPEVFAIAAGTKIISLKRRRLKEWLLARYTGVTGGTQHITDQMMVAANAMGARQDALGLDYFVPHRDQVPPDWLPELFREKFVVFYLGASHATRRLPVDRIIELCDRINKPVILLGGKTDHAIAARVEVFFAPVPGNESFEEGLNELGKKTTIYDGTGKFNFNQMASLVSRALSVFTFDSEMVAVASAMKRTTYLILGNTVLSAGRYPYQTRFVVFENNKINCRPCTQNGFDACPLRHFRCMNDISFDF